MPKLIGVDTGGTYTDAVLFSEADSVLAKAKALTTRHDLAVGIGNAVDAVMDAAAASPDEIAMVSVSTTLATNAIVEGLGDEVGLVLIGFREHDLARAGLREALVDDPVVFVRGGHDAHGSEAAPLDTGSLLQWIEDEASSVRAFAVAGQFSIANPRHELAVRDLLLQRTGRPVTCSHELSANLNAPKRALTSLLNARLIGVIHHLIDSTQSLLAERSITAPVMVVKGDGSLISASEARQRPIETILSGPAASIVGASYLTGLRDALVADIGGTTTDVALLTDGRPRLDERGARVGKWSTMVEAVAMHTVGLGGDSEVRQDPQSPTLRLSIGPRRVVPVSLLAFQFKDAVHAALDRQMLLQTVPEHAGRFALSSRRPGAERSSGDDLEASLLTAIADGPVSLHELLPSRRHHAAMQRLVAKGAAAISAFCPSDAAHVLGLHEAWDRAAAVKAAHLFAGRRTARAEKIADGADEISRGVFEAVTKRSAETLIDASLAEAGDETKRPSAHGLVQEAIENRSALLQVALSVPIVALGAAAKVYYRDVARRLNTSAVIPDHADVANAIGAVVGHIRVNAAVTISRPSEGGFRAHFQDGPKDFDQLAGALASARCRLREDVMQKAEASGARDVDITIREEQNSVMLGDEELFLETRVAAIGVGRPSFVVSR